MLSLNSSRHALYLLTYQLVIVTKNRHTFITMEMMRKFKQLADFHFDRWGCEILEVNGEEDHLTITFSATPQVQLSQMINNFKLETTISWKRTTGYRDAGFSLWSSGYMLTTIGNIGSNNVFEYIVDQGKEENPLNH